MTTIRVLQSANTIGGNCVEISANTGERILLDAGRPLDLPDIQATPLPPGLEPERPVLGIFLSHAHLDHYGMLEILPEDWPLHCGKATGELLALNSAMKQKSIRRNMTFWENDKPINLGSFTITPMLVDHSSFDSYMLEIQVDGRKILYSGDFREHGRKGRLTREILRNPPKQVDALILEGTNLSAAGKSVVAEADLENEFARLFKETAGRVFVAWAATNIDRTVTLFRACKRTGRTLVVDLYTMLILKILGKYGRIPQPDWKDAPLMAVVTGSMINLTTRMGYPDLVQELIHNPNGRKAMKAADFSENRDKWVIMIRSSQVKDYRKKGVLPDADDAWVWSLWNGYLKNESTRAVLEYMKPCGDPLQIHTSGHASLDFLRRFAQAVNPELLIPVHGDSWAAQADTFPNLRVVENGEVVALS